MLEIVFNKENLAFVICMGLLYLANTFLLKTDHVIHLVFTLGWVLGIQMHEEYADKKFKGEVKR